MGGAVLALDVGTSSVKAVRVRHDGSGRRVKSMVMPHRDTPGVDPEQVWAICVQVLTGLTGPSSGGGTIDAVVVTGQGDGLWTVEEGTDTPGTAFLWNSTVAAPVISAWQADGTIERHYRRTGTVLWSGTSAALWTWLRETDPDRVHRVRAVMTAKDWINHRLTAEIRTDVTDASIPFLHPASRTYDQASIAALGCEDLTDRLPPLVPPGQQFGTVTPSAARRTGLTAGTPVHMGCLDVVALTRGVGLRQPGDAVAVLGTTAAAMTIAAAPDSSGEPVGATVCLPGPDRVLRVMGSSSGTATLEWFLRANSYTGEDRYTAFWNDVSSVDANVTGEMMLPYLSGERAPFLAPHATGAFLGLTLQTTRGTLGRSVVEGITMALRHCLEATDATAEQLVLTGGAVASPQWCQLLADVTGRAVIADPRPDIAALGSASLLPGHDDIATSTDGERQRFAPSDGSARLQARYRQHVRLVDTLRPLWGHAHHVEEDA